MTERSENEVIDRSGLIHKHRWYKVGSNIAGMHPTTASFLGGLRMYKIVLLGEGGVGKSGQSSVKFSRTFWGWPKGIREQTFGNDCSIVERFLSEYPCNATTAQRCYKSDYETFSWECLSAIADFVKNCCLVLAPFNFQFSLIIKCLEYLNWHRSVCLW